MRRFCYIVAYFLKKCNESVFGIFWISKQGAALPRPALHKEKWAYSGIIGIEGQVRCNEDLIQLNIRGVASELNGISLTSSPVIGLILTNL